MKIKVVVIDLEIPPRVKRWALRIGIPLVSLLGVCAIALAAVPVAFQRNGPLKADELNQNFTNLDGRVAALETGIKTLYKAASGGGLSVSNNAFSIAANGVTGSMIQDGTITGADLASPLTLSGSVTADSASIANLTVSGSMAGVVEIDEYGWTDTCYAVTDLHKAGWNNVLLHASLFTDSDCKTAVSTNMNECHLFCAAGEVKTGNKGPGCCAGAQAYYTKWLARVLRYR